MSKNNDYVYIPMTQNPEDKGDSKYYDECLHVQQTMKADGVLLLVINGIRGHGFAAAMTPELSVKIPALLRKMANDIENDMKGQVNS